MTYPSKLNLGCGTDIRENYYNVDLKPLEGVDLAEDIRDLKLPLDSFEEITLQDVIEHFTLTEAKEVLSNCFGWLKTGGLIWVSTQNIRFLAYNLSVGDSHEALKWLYGADGSRGNVESAFHRWGYSGQSLSSLLEGCGFWVERVYVDCGGFRVCVTAYKKNGEKLE